VSSFGGCGTPDPSVSALTGRGGLWISLLSRRLTFPGFIDGYPASIMILVPWRSVFRFRGGAHSRLDDTFSWVTKWSRHLVSAICSLMRTCSEADGTRLPATIPAALSPKTRFEFLPHKKRISLFSSGFSFSLIQKGIRLRFSFCQYSSVE